MKKKRNFNNIWLILACWTLLGCNTSKIPVSEEPFLSTATKSITRVGIDTVTLTPQPPRTSTSVGGSIIFPVKTMSAQESEIALLNLLGTNGNCSGKCIAGIRPDEMSVQEAIVTMSQWGMIRYSENSQGKTFINLVQYPLDGKVFVELSIGTWTSKLNTIDRVHFYIGGTPGYGLLGKDIWLSYHKNLAGFRLDTILKTYGTPSYVGFFFQTAVDGGIPLESSTIAYSTEIQYERLSIVVGMGAKAFHNGENLLICPSKDPHDLGIEINPERPLIESQEFRPVTWQAITETDLEVFYSVFTDDPDACITTTLKKIQLLQPSFH